MTRNELSRALAIAYSDEELDETNAPISPFDGYGLPDFDPVYVTVYQIARLIRWQCFFWDGTLDNDEFQGIATLGRKRFLVI